VVETLPSEDLPITAINATGGAFGWLTNEPHFYDDNDLLKQYRV
jgi:hypothetical protein